MMLVSMTQSKTGIAQKKLSWMTVNISDVEISLSSSEDVMNLF
jgi:hypothetical protein